MDKPALSRRAFAAQAAALGAALAFGPITARAASPARKERRDLYPQGVASGDPRADSVILWTRRAPDAGAASHRLTVEIASDAKFAKRVAGGSVSVTAATDWTCRFLAAGLKPGREYWYRFVDEAGNTSRIGRTLTAPADDDDRPARFAFVSCQDVTQGAMNAYRRMLYEDARRPRAEQLGFVLHLGDFIYELVWYRDERPNGMERGRRLRDVVRYPHGEKVSTFNIPTDLDDYRTAYRGYLTDPDLQDARAQWPFVPVWDNHEFNWRSFQSQQIVDGKIRAAQKLKVAASQAWYEYQPARVRKPGSGDVFEAPVVENKPVDVLDARGLSQEPNNLIAIKALQIQRAFRYGKNIDLILTDNRSLMSPGGDYSGLPDIKFSAMPEAMLTILDQGEACNGGSPPARIKVGDLEFDNPNAKGPPEAYLGIEQMAWFKDRLRSAKAPWKIWGHSFGTLMGRTDPENLPATLADRWPKGAGYGVTGGGGYTLENGEIFDMVRQEGITGFAIVAGDRHAFWAGYPSKTLPPRDFDPVGVEFITGSISAQTMGEVNALTMPKDRPLRPLYIDDKPDGAMECSFGMTVMHGVKSAFVLKETGDPAKARAARNPELAPHLKFVDHAGHGYTTVRASATELETEFVCIPFPLERSETDDGGPLRYRVVHRVSLWKPGEPPQLRQEVVEGDPGLAI